MITAITPTERVPKRAKLPPGSGTTQHMYHVYYAVSGTTEKWVDLRWITPAPPPADCGGRLPRRSRSSAHSAHDTNHLENPPE